MDFGSVWISVESVTLWVDESISVDSVRYKEKFQWNLNTENRAQTRPSGMWTGFSNVFWFVSKFSDHFFTWLISYCYRLHLNCSISFKFTLTQFLAPSFVFKKTLHYNRITENRNGLPKPNRNLGRYRLEKFPF